MSSSDSFKDVLNPKHREGTIRRKILKAVANNPGIIGKEVFRSLKGNVSGSTSKSAVYGHIDTLKKRELIEKRGDGQSNPLFLTDTGRVACKELGISLPKDYEGNFIDTLDELMEPSHLDSEEIKKLEHVLSKDILRTTIEISSKFPVSLDLSSIGISEDRIRNWKINTLEILKGLWFFERQNHEAEVFPQKAERRTVKRKEGVKEKLSAIAIAQKRGCRSELLDLCKILEDLSLRDSLLSEIRNVVKNAYLEHRGKSQPSSEGKGISAVELEIRRKHTEDDLKPELESLRNWIRKMDVGVRDVGIRLIERYEPKKEWTFQDLENHVPGLINGIKNFTERLKKLKALNDSFLKMISNPEIVATVKNCVSLSEDNETPGNLTERLKRRGVDVEKGSPFLDKSALESSEEHMKIFEERLKKMVNLSAELEGEREDIFERINELLSQKVFPGYCPFIREQL